MKQLAIFLLVPLFFAGALAAPPTVYMIGDSTMADKPDPTRNPERGWGQLLPGYFQGGVQVKNFAVNGRSSKSFIDEGRWKTVLDQVKPGDYVFIQFGHNDEKREDPTRYTNPLTGFRHNLERFVNEARAKGGVPILFSPLTRRNFNDKGVLEDTHGLYPLVVRDVARELQVPFVDLQEMTEELVLSAGIEGSKSLYVWVKPGENAMYPTGHEDNTHLSVKGATLVAGLAVRGLRALRVPLARYTRESWTAAAQ